MMSKISISAAETSASRPVITLNQGHGKRLKAGHPWVFSNEIRMDKAAKALPAGSLVDIADPDGTKVAVASFNPHSLIALRVLSRDCTTRIDQSWLQERLSKAAALRDFLFGAPFYRLIHAEADDLPGLIVDRYGDVFTVQINSAGMQKLLPDLLAGLNELFAPKAVVLRNDSPVRALEGLELSYEIALGAIDGPVELMENGARFLADLTEGQKTGWFYDQRDNRAFMARLARGRSVIDFYTYAGGFAIQCALGGATHVTAIDRSDHSLSLARKAAEMNNVAVEFRRAEAFGEMERLAREGQKFGVVIVDPPAFVKSKKDRAAGAKGYRKMARLAAALVEEGGFLFCASCSHHMPDEEFCAEIARGIDQAGRSGRILRRSGAGPDHPLHPLVPESAYLKAVTLQLM